MGGLQPPTTPGRRRHRGAVCSAAESCHRRLIDGSSWSPDPGPARSRSRGFHPARAILGHWVREGGQLGYAGLPRPWGDSRILTSDSQLDVGRDQVNAARASATAVALTNKLNRRPIMANITPRRSSASPVDKPWASRSPTPKPGAEKWRLDPMRGTGLTHPPGRRPRPGWRHRTHGCSVARQGVSSSKGVSVASPRPCCHAGVACHGAHPPTCRVCELTRGRA